MGKLDVVGSGVTPETKTYIEDWYTKLIERYPIAQTFSFAVGLSKGFRFGKLSDTEIRVMKISWEDWSYTLYPITDVLNTDVLTQYCKELVYCLVERMFNPEKCAKIGFIGCEDNLENTGD